MKPALLVLLSAATLFLGACETDMPSEPGQHPVKLGGPTTREDGFDQKATPATDLEQHVW